MQTLDALTEVSEYLAVIPSIYQPYTKACLETCPLMRVMVVDNTVHNRGVAASWNEGVHEMNQLDLEWLVIVSAAVRFGEPGGLDFIQHLKPHRNVNWPLVVEANGYGWHLIAFRNTVFNNVGVFDENFLGPLSDNDFGRRITLWLRKGGYRRHYCVHCKTEDISGHHHEGCPDPVGGWIPSALWRKVSVDYTVESINHGVELGGAKDDTQHALDYYEEKWGGPRQAETFDHPFGDARRDLTFWQPSL